MWIYKNNDDNSVRFILGEDGKSPLVCFGVNPSTATPEKLDRTLVQVQKTAKKNKEFDGWIMLNVYPQRATNPGKLHLELDKDIHRKNLAHIKDVFCSNPKLTVWAAWGGLIEKRPFLKECLKDIVEIIKPYKAQWVCRGDLVAKRHPHHPLYLGNDLPFRPFDVEGYLKTFMISDTPGVSSGTKRRRTSDETCVQHFM